MSRTDNTQPYALQAVDTTRPGYMYHSCCWNGSLCQIAEQPVLPDFVNRRKGGKHGWRNSVIHTNCSRELVHFGGMAGDSEANGYETRRLNRQDRRSAKAALGRLNPVDADAFDIMPGRWSRRTVRWNLS
ncbi:hypothetical protein IPG36_00580 [bacterium]|nr:MAG: hypothetical protein IPG36_00580 [bacterium]